MHTLLPASLPPPPSLPPGRRTISLDTQSQASRGVHGNLPSFRTPSPFQPSEPSSCHSHLLVAQSPSPHHATYLFGLRTGATDFLPTLAQLGGLRLDGFGCFGAHDVAKMLVALPVGGCEWEGQKEGE